MLRMLRMLRTLRLPGRLAVLLGAALAAAGLAVAGAQLAPVFFEIAAAEHDPSGRVIASIAVPDDVELERGKITALLDGVPFPVSDVTRRDPEPLAVVLAIDVSGSMSGGPLAAARQAALDLVERLNAADRVAVVAFADAPVVFSDFTLDREVTNATLRSLVAGGDTALYGAVDTAAQMLAAAGSQRGVLVLLSDGLDDGGVSTVGREQSVDAIVASGAAAYAFALGVQADVAYLGALAERAGGEFAEVTDEQALAAAFAGLGRRLGADVSVTVAVPPQQIGEHELTLRFRAQEEVVEARSRFEVTNAGLVSPIITTPGAPEDEILVELAALVPLASLTLEATANGEPLPLIASTGRMLIDPWLFEPGALQIDFRVTVRGALAAAATATVEIPALEPQITLQQRTDDGGARQLVVSGRVQGSTTAVLRVLVDGEEIARSEEPRLIVAEPTGATAEVILEDGAGGLLKSVPLTLAAPAVAPIPAPAATAAEEGGGSAVLLIAAGAAVVLALLGLVLLRRRRGPPSGAAGGAGAARARPARCGARKRGRRPRHDRAAPPGRQRGHPGDGHEGRSRSVAGSSATSCSTTRRSGRFTSVSPRSAAGSSASTAWPRHRCARSPRTSPSRTNGC